MLNLLHSLEYLGGYLSSGFLLKRTISVIADGSVSSFHIDVVYQNAVFFPRLFFQWFTNIGWNDMKSVHWCSNDSTLHSSSIFIIVLPQSHLKNNAQFFFTLNASVSPYPWTQPFLIINYFSKMFSHEHENSIKIVGGIITSNLFWKPHISTIAKNASSGLG